MGECPVRSAKVSAAILQMHFAHSARSRFTRRPARIPRGRARSPYADSARNESSAGIVEVTTQDRHPDNTKPHGSLPCISGQARKIQDETEGPPSAPPIPSPADARLEMQLANIETASVRVRFCSSLEAKAMRAWMRIWMRACGESGGSGTSWA